MGAASSQSGWQLYCLSLVLLAPGIVNAQAATSRLGDAIPRDVREMYDRGLQHLANTQSEAGDWPNSGQVGPGVTGMCLMAFLASGEDPNFGIYASQVRRAIRNIISSQHAGTGY